MNQTKEEYLEWLQNLKDGDYCITAWSSNKDHPNMYSLTQIINANETTLQLACYEPSANRRVDRATGHHLTKNDELDYTCGIFPYDVAAAIELIAKKDITQINQLEPKLINEIVRHYYPNQRTYSDEAYQWTFPNK